MTALVAVAVTIGAANVTAACWLIAAGLRAEPEPDPRPDPGPVPAGIDPWTLAA